MLTEEYRKTDEYATFSAMVLKEAPGLPQSLVEQAIFMHKKDPYLYRKWPKIERDVKEAQRKEEHLSVPPTKGPPN